MQNNIIEYKVFTLILQSFLTNEMFIPYYLQKASTRLDTIVQIFIILLNLRDFIFTQINS